MPNEHLIESVRVVIEWAALGIEMLGALIIVAGVLRVAITRGTVRFLLKLDQPRRRPSRVRGGRFTSCGHKVTSSSMAYWPARWSPRRPPFCRNTTARQ